MKGGVADAVIVALFNRYECFELTIAAQCPSPLAPRPLSHKGLRTSV